MPFTFTAKAPALPVLQARFSDEDPRILQAFVRFTNGDLKKSVSHYERVKKWRAELGPLTSVSEMEPYLRCDNHMVTLEASCKRPDSSGGVIIYMNGMITGTRDEMTRQVVFAVERAWACICGQDNAGALSKMQLVINARGPHFRFPDADFRTAVFGVMRDKYPWLMDLTVVFLDLPSFMYVPLMAVRRMLPTFRDRFRVMKAKDWIAQEGIVKAFLNHEPVNCDPADGGLVFDVDTYLRAENDPSDTDASLSAAQSS